MTEYQNLPNFDEAPKTPGLGLPSQAIGATPNTPSDVAAFTVESSIPEIPEIPGAIIQIRNLRKDYGNIKALQGINLDLAPGRIVALMGHNGCGKTTMLKILAGLMMDYSGEVAICGMKPSERTKGMVSYLPDAPALPAGMRISTALQMYQDFFKDFELEKALDLLQHFQIDAKHKFRELSKGNKEKLQIAMTMSRNARVYLLDEPLSGVDPAARQVILDGIVRGYRPDALLVVSTHLIHDIEYVVDEAIFMQNGFIQMHANADEARARSGKSLDAMFRETFACSVNW